MTAFNYRAHFARIRCHQAAEARRQYAQEVWREVEKCTFAFGITMIAVSGAIAWWLA